MSKAKRKPRDSVADLNDRFRKALAERGIINVSPGVFALGRHSVGEAIAKSVHYRDFTPETDLLGERARGGFSIMGRVVLWGIDYLPIPGTEDKFDPGAPNGAFRIMNIFLPEEL